MKKADIPKLKAEILKMMPMPQAEISKKLNIDAKSCSVVVKLMIDKKLVGRKKVRGKIIVEKFDVTKHCDKDGSAIIIEEKKTESIPELSTKLLKILPALQSDIGKKLGIKRRQCSRLMITLENNGLIKRKKVKGGTYMVEKCGVNDKPVKQISFNALLSDSGRFSPCAGCNSTCEPKSCTSLTNWILDIKV